MIYRTYIYSILLMIPLLFSCHHPVTTHQMMTIADSLITCHNEEEARKVLERVNKKRMTQEESMLDKVLSIRIDIATGHYPLSIKEINQCIAFYEDNNKKEYLAKALTAKAQILINTRKQCVNDAFILLLRARHISKDIKKNSLYAEVCLHLSLANYLYGAYTMAAMYGSEATQYAKQEKQKILVKLCNTATAQAFRQLGMRDSAMRYDNEIYNVAIDENTVDPHLVYNIVKSQTDYENTVADDLVTRYGNGYITYAVLFFLLLIIVSVMIVYHKRKTLNLHTKNLMEKRELSKKVEELKKKVERETGKNIVEKDRNKQLKKDLAQLAATHKKELSQKNEETAKLLIVGEQLYRMINKRQNISQWNKDEETCLIAYYMAKRPDFAHTVDNEYARLSNHQLIFLILVNEGLSEDEIRTVMSIQQNNLRKIKSVVKSKKQNTPF